MSADYYQILGVDRQATEQEIRRAYYRKAKLWHPDVNPSRSAKSNFQIINHAYSVLSDASRRRAYDTGVKDPWVRNERRDYYRYGTSVRQEPNAAGSSQRSEKQESTVRSPLLDKVLFGSLLFFGISGIILGVFDVIMSSEEEVLKLTGLMTGLVFTGLLLYGWNMLRKEWRGKK